MRKQIVKRMVLSTIHVSQAHILEKQSRCRTAGFEGHAQYGYAPKIAVRLFLYVNAIRRYVAIDAKLSQSCADLFAWADVHVHPHYLVHLMYPSHRPLVSYIYSNKCS